MFAAVSAIAAAAALAAGLTVWQVESGPSGRPSAQPRSPLLPPTGAHAAIAQTAAVLAYPSSQQIAATGPLPASGGRTLTLNAAIGDVEDGVVVVHRAPTVAATVEHGRLGPLTVQLLFGHFVAFGSRLVPDALVPWDGSKRKA